MIKILGQPDDRIYTHYELANNPSWYNVQVRDIWEEVSQYLNVPFNILWAQFNCWYGGFGFGEGQLCDKITDDLRSKLLR